jgi:putative DNA primase/helicase
VTGQAGLAGIVRVLGGDLYERGRRAVVPGPGHSRADRSVSLLLVGDRVVVHSFAGDDWRQVLKDLRTRGLVDVRGRLAGNGSATLEASAPSRPERIAVALTLWETARPIDGALSALHLQRRGVGRTAPDALRHHPAVPAAVYAGRGLRRPALLAAVRDHSGDLCAVELTYLAPDGAAASITLPRKTVGCAPAGCAVRLDPPGETLLVGEGVFSCLSASEALGLPVWALRSVGSFGRWAPPAGVRRVVIAADRGRVGEAAALALARRLRGMGLAAFVRWPPAGFADWNEAAPGWAAAPGGRGKAGEGGPGPGDRPPAGPGA